MLPHVNGNALPAFGHCMYKACEIPSEEENDRSSPEKKITFQIKFYEKEWLWVIYLTYAPK